MICFVTPDIGDDLDGWARLVRAAIDGGVSTIQIRDKTSRYERIIEGAARIRPYLGNTLLYINDRVDLVGPTHADGIHLGQSDLPVLEARARLGNEIKIGLSVETLDQALEADSLPVTYLAASPVFQTKSKGDCASPWGLEGLEELCRASSHPIVAIGGITAERIPHVMRCGVYGVAVVSAIADALDSRQATHDLIQSVSFHERL